MSPRTRARVMGWDLITPGRVPPRRKRSEAFRTRHAAGPRNHLTSLDPHRAGEYEWMRAEIDYSRVYLAGHAVSDVTGGALLGDMIGEYVSLTR